MSTGWSNIFRYFFLCFTHIVLNNAVLVVLRSIIYFINPVKWQSPDASGPALWFNVDVSASWCFITTYIYLPFCLHCFLYQSFYLLSHYWHSYMICYVCGIFVCTYMHIYHMLLLCCMIYLQVAMDSLGFPGRRMKYGIVSLKHLLQVHCIYMWPMWLVAATLHCWTRTFLPTSVFVYCPCSVFFRAYHVCMNVFIWFDVHINVWNVLCAACVCRRTCKPGNAYILRVDCTNHCTSSNITNPLWPQHGLTGKLANKNYLIAYYVVKLYTTTTITQWL